MPEPLTKLERRILDWLEDYVRRNTYQPSIREIGRRFDIKSTKTVSEYLQSLADKGWIERDPSRSRGVKLLGMDLFIGTVTVPHYDLRTGSAQPLDDGLSGFELDRRLAGPAGTFFVSMSGDSMAGAGILDGDRLFVEPVPRDELEDGDIVVARLNGEGTVKRLFQREDEVVLEPENPDYAPVLVKRSDRLEVLGRVAGVFRQLHPLAERVPTPKERAEARKGATTS